MPGTLTENLDNLYTTTWQNMKSVVGDNIFDATPFWFWLKKGGGLETCEGGRFITEPLRYAKSDNVAWVQKGSTVPLAEKEFLTVARYDWRYLADSIVRYGVDDQQNRGKNQIMNLMNAKLQNSKDTLVDTLETALAGTVAATGAVSGIAGLQRAVPDDPTAAVEFGGIDPSLYTWWRNQFTDMTGESFASLGLMRMRTMYNKVMNNLGMDKANIIVSGQTPYEFYEDEVEEQKRIVNKTLGDAGFQNIEFKGTPMVWSPAISNQRMYFLNTKFMKFKYDPMLYFDMTEWKAIPNQVNDRVAQIVLAGELVMSRRRCQGVIFDIDTA